MSILATECKLFDRLMADFSRTTNPIGHPIRVMQPLIQHEVQFVIGFIRNESIKEFVRSLV